MEKFLLACDMDFADEREWQILWIFELLFICKDLDRMEFEHPIPQLVKKGALNQRLIDRSKNDCQEKS